ncbi:hypothetical protein [Micromonospora zhanjiangensis]|uniref:Peptide zinc metalloprotease protein n=1 Tax=Micromonospora zhanjiangensis TaxID=1522057 RepID=A0ABV8KW70_9ACTN
MTTADGDLAVAASRLVVARDGDECVLGRPDLGIFVQVPEPGAVFVEALQAGVSVTGATERASEVAGEPVDGEDFLATLAEVGLLDASPAADAGSAGARRTREIRWIAGISPRVAARLFGRAAWSVYGTAAVVAVALLVARPELRPTYESFWFLGDPMASVLALIPATIVLSCLHEAWHWLAGRAIGLPAVFRVSYRGIFLVFETDLSQIVTVPRRRRYGPFFAGLAFDATMLAVFLLLRLADHRSWLSLPPLMDRFLGALVLRQVFAIVWQLAAVFLRNDMYAVLTTALRCTNMYRVNALTIKDRLARLTPDEARELAEASDRDRAVAPWFAAIYLAGIVAMFWMFLVAGLPNMIVMVGWLANSLGAHAAGSPAFWEAVAVAGYLVATLALPAVLALRERRLRQRGALS